MTPTAKDNRDLDIAMWKCFLSALDHFEDTPGYDESDDAVGVAINCVEEKFGESPEWIVDVHLGVVSPFFTYSDGITVNFKELGQ